MYSQNTIHNYISITKNDDVKSCDAYIIIDDILGIQNMIVFILSLTEGTDVVINLIDDDVWEDEDEQTSSLNDYVESWDLICL